MADGSSGLSLSEIGISSVKKTAQVIKKFGSPAAQQIKHQLGGANVPYQNSQSSNTPVPNEAISNIGNFDTSNLNEQNAKSTTTNQSGVPPQIQNTQNALANEQQKQNDQQQIDMLRKKLHNIYFEEFINKAEGKDQKKQEELQRRQQIEQDEEEARKQKEEQQMEPIMMSQGPKKGFGKKVKSSLMNLLKPKQGSHEGKASKG